MTLPLVTERLEIREYTLDDLDDLAGVFVDPLLAAADEPPLTREQSRAWLEEEMSYVRRDGIGRYAIVLRETGRVVGGCGLVRRELKSGVTVELGYHLRSDVWGRGLATEAARACLAEARARGLRRVVAFVQPGNARSQAVARRIGMRRTGRVTWFGSPHEHWVIDLA